MRLAQVGDVASRLQRTLTAAETTASEGLLDEASDLVRAWMKCVPDPVPDEVTRVVARMVARVFEAKGQMQSMTVPYGTTQMTDTAGRVTMNRTLDAGVTSGSPWLTKADKTVLRPFGCRGRAATFPTA